MLQTLPKKNEIIFAGINQNMLKIALNIRGEE
jgi:hypothetical protein